LTTAGDQGEGVLSHVIVVRTQGSDWWLSAWHGKIVTGAGISVMRNAVWGSEVSSRGGRCAPHHRAWTPREEKDVRKSGGRGEGKNETQSDGGSSVEGMCIGVGRRGWYY